MKKQPIPNNCEHMSFSDFVHCCDDRLFTDRDGTGYYATDKEMTDIEIRPSDVLNCRDYLDSRFKYVCWFNM